MGEPGELTKLQYRCFCLIDHYIKENKQAPTRRELTELLGQKSITGVNQILEALQKKGYIKIDPPRQKRNIKILKRPHRQMDLFDDNDEV